MPVTETVTPKDLDTTVKVLIALVEADQPDDGRPGAGGDPRIRRSVSVILDALERHQTAVLA